MLAALVKEPQHGYAVMKRVNSSLGRRALLGPGTLYRALKELRDKGLIEEAEVPQAAEVDQRRRYYRLTTVGRGVVDAEADRLADLVRTVRSGERLTPNEGFGSEPRSSLP